MASVTRAMLANLGAGPERWNGGTVERWNGGAVERWSGGAMERWGDGTVEPWIDEIVKRQAKKRTGSAGALPVRSLSPPPDEPLPTFSRRSGSPFSRSRLAPDIAGAMPRPGWPTENPRSLPPLCRLTACRAVLPVPPLHRGSPVAIESFVPPFHRSTGFDFFIPAVLMIA